MNVSISRICGYPRNVESAKKIVCEFVTQKKIEMSSCLGTTMVEV